MSKTNMPKAQTPNNVKAVYLHQGEYQIMCLMDSITLAYKPMTVRKDTWPAIAFDSADDCRRIANELLQAADAYDKMKGKSHG